MSNTVETSKKRRVGFSDDKNNKKNSTLIREIQKKAAEKSAPGFARPTKQPIASTSTTPTGVLRTEKNLSSEEKEAWPGPFSTALQIIEKREEAKKLRLEAIAKKEAGATPVFSDIDLDIYDISLSKLQWIPKNQCTNRSGEKQIPSLINHCIQAIVKLFNVIDDVSIIPFEIKEKISVELVRRRLFNDQALLKLAIENSDSLIIPDCSNIEDKTIIQAIKKISGIEDNNNDDNNDKFESFINQLHVLHLKNCGHCVTNNVAEFLVSFIGSLELLQLTGCYKLADEALSNIFATCRQSLRVLDLSCNSKLGTVALSMISKALPVLEELTLDNCTQLVDDDLLCLLPIIPSSSSSSIMIGIENLTHLSLNGLIEVTDDSVSLLIKTYGQKLKSLNIGGCVRLTDKTVMSIRNCCGSLQHLNLNHLSDVSTTTLIGLFIANPNQNQNLFANNDHGDKIENNTAIDGENEFLITDQILPPSIENDSSFDIIIPLCIGNQLQTISLQGAVNTTDDVIVHLSELSKSSLRKLNVSGCYQLTQKSIMALNMNCKENIEELDISFVRNISNDVLGKLVDDCQDFRLKVLSIWGCTQLTTKFFNGYTNKNVEIIGRMIA